MIRVELCRERCDFLVVKCIAVLGCHVALLFRRNGAITVGRYQQLYDTFALDEEKNADIKSQKAGSGINGIIESFRNGLYLDEETIGVNCTNHAIIRISYHADLCKTIWTVDITDCQVKGCIVGRCKVVHPISIMYRVPDSY